MDNDLLPALKKWSKKYRKALNIRTLTLRRIFPLWLKWEYVRKLFIMPDGLSERGIKVAAADYIEIGINRKRGIRVNLKEQEYICTLAQCGSITEAAKHLFITQPALSAYISNVERSLGIELFDRKGKILQLTYAGELYVEKAKRMLVMKKEYHREVEDILRGVQGRLRIGVQARRAPYLVVEITRQFQAIYPQVELEFELGISKELKSLFQNRKLDLIIHNDPLEIGNAVRDVLINEKLLLVMCKRDALVENGTYLADCPYRWLDLKFLEDRTVILPKTGHSLRVDCNHLLSKAGVIPKKIVEIGHIDTATQMAAEGYGISFTRESYAAQFQYLKQPEFFVVGMPVEERPLYAIYREDMAGSRQISCIVDIIRNVVKEIFAKRML